MDSRSQIYLEVDKLLGVENEDIVIFFLGLSTIISGDDLNCANKNAGLFVEALDGGFLSLNFSCHADSRDEVLLGEKK